MKAPHKKIRVIALWIMVVSGCMFLYASLASAYAQTAFGKSGLKAGIAYKTEYNDNIFWEADNEVDDFIFTLTPSIGYQYTGSPGNFFTLGYRADFVAYSDFDENNYDYHNPYLRGGLKTPAGFYIRFSESYVNTEDPYGSENEYGLGLSTERWNNTVSIDVGFNFSKKHGIEASYKNFLERYDDTTDKWENRTDNLLGISLLYKATGKTTLFCQYRHKEVDYPEQEDGIAAQTGPDWSSATSQNNEQDDFFIGARFSPFGKLTGEVKLGYGNIQWDNRMDRNGIRYEDEDTWIAETRVKYKVRERTNLSFMLSRSYKVTSLEGGDAPGYFDTRVGIGLSQEMKHRLTGTLGFEWRALDYQKPGIEEYFNDYTIKTGLAYHINKWADAGIHYKYRSRVATEDLYEDSEFDINSVSVMISVKY